MRVLKVRERNCDFESNGTIKLKHVMRNRFINGNYTHVQLNGEVIECQIIDGLTGSREVSQWSNVWIK